MTKKGSDESNTNIKKSIIIKVVKIYSKFMNSRCPYAASTRSTLQKHISVIHDKERPYRCDLCPSASFGQKVSPV